MKKYAIGIDLGGTSVKYALIDNEGVFHFQGKLPSKADVSAEAVIGQLVTACKEAMASALQLGVAVEGIGIGTPGIVDETNRIVLGGAENIKGWENLNLADRIEAETGLPVQMGNDANLMGLGETMYGAGNGATHVVFQISVISQLGRKSGLFFHPVCQFQIFPALNILRTSQYDTIRTIDNSRCPYPDTGYRIFLCFGKGFHFIDCLD